ncbi:MAG TPA: aminotransferase class I/II-fold pyridoxal phosphate-dependent enzyme [Catalimonadaceae bacterium]|nr:aminotransferase class I/II-fold pyridoxal phosphate-dependent enzyme [Catalimonadaceae bacterium]
MSKPLPPKIWLSSPHMGNQEFEFVRNAFETNWIAPLGPHVDGFEKDLSEFLNIGHAAALSSGTAALHLAMILLGIGVGDTVLCSSFTFSATANPIAYQGATPVFVDSETLTWNMDPDLAEEAIKSLISQGKKPKAMVVVHLYGMPAQMDRLMEISRQYEIPMIEDAAEALGSTLNGKCMGTFGLMGILSFNGNKIITTSGGGALLSENPEYISKARFLATQARDSAPHYQHSHIGFNYRMSNVVAGIGRGQMLVLPERIRQRKANHAFYNEALSSYSGIQFLHEPEGYFSNRWLTCILVDPEKTGGVSRETIRLALEKENIETRPLWKPMHMQPIFESAPAYANGVSEKLFDQGLCLPSGSNLLQADLDRVVAAISEVLK